jgi:protein TonB
VELKKSSKADLERKRIYFFFAGLLISSGLLYLALEWKYVPAASDDLSTFITLDDEIEILEENFTAPEEELPEIPPATPVIPQAPVTAEIFDVAGNDAQVKPVDVIPEEDLSEESLQEEHMQELLELNGNTPADELLYVQVEEMPEFPGGYQAFIRYLAANVRYMPSARAGNIGGQVFCSFIINKEGKVTRPEIIKGLDASLDREAIRAIRAMPDWKPGRNKNEPVSVKYIVPITFGKSNK